MGCSLATKPWVDNHWSLILWKLAGMVCLDPDKERESGTRRWCPREVMRQLLYRYERELNGGSRPPLRLITTRDSPSAAPMILCVSNISWEDRGLREDGILIPPRPELEVTDGWYRLRAQVDDTLARAIRKGKIRVGRKLDVVGAKLRSTKREPCEVLEAYNSTHLELFGNSSRMAPWHAKLGFKQDRCIVGLHKLTADGGPIPVLHVAVTKVFPLGFLEIIETEDGQQLREGPRCEKDELEVQQRWEMRRSDQELKLLEGIEKRFSRLSGWVERLERKAGDTFRQDDYDSQLDYLEALWEKLEAAADPASLINNLGARGAGWLARFIREQSIKERNRSREDIEQELKDLCPPRNVKDFRVIEVTDARSERNNPLRKAQMTVWGAMALERSEDGESIGCLKEGQTFLVTNVQPSQQKAWMAPGVDSVVYLSTTRQTRWTKTR
ncbi:hypothetical protein PUNSTDRAFT_117563 [Punctularia strigosozonata HHB-11173 SS5]|uniref:uncharacterized protein n=1 Tax=Punctularia strigosozonata (strain HHB-11173) TaxID=741275 RepID=UPI0004417759|nr:uncharacterized protein PUNSTDRAFT_117563 [Punctularia strigosozonata HHB-11173 SS5]EIN13926.1 hypothetical protein PUNSTDRAFT_117563 [Punctularia strigosozonata HHB-11173 SS5]